MCAVSSFKTGSKSQSSNWKASFLPLSNYDALIDIFKPDATRKATAYGRWYSIEFIKLLGNEPIPLAVEERFGTIGLLELRSSRKATEYSAQTDMEMIHSVSIRGRIRCYSLIRALGLCKLCSHYMKCQILKSDSNRSRQIMCGFGSICSPGVGFLNCDGSFSRSYDC